MFSKVAIFVAATLAVVASAAPASAGQCNTGPVQCCNSVQNAQEASTAKVLAPLGIILEGVQGLVGLNCSPISAIALAGNSCSQQAVCCEKNEFNGLVAVGCTPINVNA